MPERLRFGMIGCGSIAEIAHFPCIAAHPQAELVAVCDINADTARQAAAKWGAAGWHTDYRALLERGDLDAVIIATPNCAHREQAIAAAEAGVDMLVEKPLAVTNREAWDIVEAARRAGVKLMVGCDRRFALPNQWGKQLLDEGLIGAIRMCRASLHEHWHLYQNHVAKTDFRLRPELAGSAAIGDTGAHAIDLLRWLVGSEVTRVVGIAERLATPESYTPLDDAVWILMQFADGGYGCVSCNRFSPAVSSVTELYGTEGTLMLSTDAQNPYQTAPVALFTNKDFNYEDLPELVRQFRYPQLFWVEDLIHRPVQKRWVALYPPRVPSYIGMFDHFVQCLLEDREPLVTGEDGAKAIEIMCAVFKSMQTRAWVDLPLTEEVAPPHYRRPTAEGGR